MPVLSAGLAATLAAIGVLAIAAFQAALALGAPLGRAAWGGKSRELPPNLRRASAVAIVIWVLAAIVILGRAGIQVVPLPNVILVWGAWALVVVSVLGAIGECRVLEPVGAVRVGAAVDRAHAAVVHDGVEPGLRLAPSECLSRTGAPNARCRRRGRSR